MAGGAYVALSGLRTRMDQLDRVAADLANAGTAGYKSEKVTTVAVERPSFNAALQTAVDVVAGPGRLDFRNGQITPTNRDLDMALEGRGFFEVQTETGARYTRNGQFERRSDGVLVTADGQAVMGENGPITLGAGQISVQPDGTVRTGNTVAGKVKIVEFADASRLRREDAGRFRYEGTAAPTRPTGTTIKSGAIEQSNVSVVDRMVQLTEVGRSFEALQRGVTVLMNDVDGKAIAELGRR